jgi:hypothetical protein
MTAPRNGTAMANVKIDMGNDNIGGDPRVG